MKIKLAVLFGGKSVEHEISVISALQAIKSINAEKYEVIPVYITKNSEFYYGEKLTDIAAFKDIPKLMKSCEKVFFISDGSRTYLSRENAGMFGKKVISEIDVAFPIVHGTNVEDGTLQGFLKTLNLPFVGCDVCASAIGMDKYAQKILLKEAGYPVLDCLRFSNAEMSDMDKLIKRCEDKFEYPLIVKPVNLGSSVGITKVSSAEELKDAVETAFSFAKRILVEPAVNNLREINCSVVGDSEEAEASECEEPFNTDEILSYADKYLGSDSKTSGGSKGMASLKRRIPAEISDELREKIRTTAVEAFKYLDCNGVTRIDFLMDGKTGEYWINEFNTIPGSLSFYLWEAVGVKYPMLLERLIALALKRQRSEESISYSFDTNVLASCGSLGAKGSKGGKL